MKMIALIHLNIMLLWLSIFFPPYISSAQCFNGVTLLVRWHSFANSLKSHCEMKQTNWYSMALFQLHYTDNYNPLGLFWLLWPRTSSRHERPRIHFIGNMIPIMPYTNHTQTLLFPCRRNINFCLIRTLNRQKLHFFTNSEVWLVSLKPRNVSGVFLFASSRLIMVRSVVA